MLVEVQKQANVDFDLSYEQSTRFTSWSKHCSNLYDELLSLIIDTKTILVQNILKASALIGDIQDMTMKVPHGDVLVDMTNELYMWISMSHEGYELKELFLPPE